MADGALMAEREARVPEGPARPPARGRKGGLPLRVSPRWLLEAAYVVLLAFLLMRLVYAFLMPIEAPAVGAAPGAATGLSADVSVFSRFDPFGGAGDAEPAEASYAGAAETTLDLRLVGLTLGGGVKTATIEVPDGTQRSFAVGPQVVGGVTLRDVLPNQAILDRNGLAETLTLRNRDGRASNPGRAPQDLPASRRAPPPARVQTLTPGQALDTLSRSFDFAPAEDGGYALSPGADPALFDAAGFADGDVVVAVDGQAAPQDPERLVELMADLPPGRPFTVTVERDGIPLDVPVDLEASR